MNEQRRSGGKVGTCRAVRCRRCRRRRLMVWNTWPRCTARPSAIQPRMAAPTDAARSTSRASEPSCPASSRGPSAPGGAGGGGAVALLPELVKNPEAGMGSGGRRRRSSTRSSSIAASQRRRPPYGRLSHLTPSARVVAQLRSVEPISPSAQHNNIAHQPTLLSKKKKPINPPGPLRLSLVVPLALATGRRVGHGRPPGGRRVVAAGVGRADRPSRAILVGSGHWETAMHAVSIIHGSSDTIHG